MKTLKTFTFISLLTLGLTQSVFAAWWNPFTWHFGWFKRSAPTTQAVAQHTSDTQEESLQLTYSSTTKGFLFKYPNTTFEVREGVDNVSVYPVPQPTEFGPVLNIKITKITKPNLESEVNNFITAYKQVQKKSEVTINGMKWTKVEYKDIGGGGPEFDYVAYLTIYNNEFYRAQYNRSTEVNNTAFEKIVSTLKFTELETTSGWKTYKNDKYGFEIKYPTNWQVEENSNLSVRFLNPLKKGKPDSDEPTEAVNVIFNVKNCKDSDWKVGFGLVNYKTVCVAGSTTQIEMVAFSGEAKKIEQDMVSSFIKTSVNSSATSENSITKTNWGISFNYGKDWNVTENTDTKISLRQVSGEWAGDTISIEYFSGINRITDSDAKFGPVAYYWSEEKKAWLMDGSNVKYGDNFVGIVATPSRFVFDTTPVFTGTTRWLTYIVPLNKTTFVKLHISGGGDKKALNDLMDTLKKIK